MKSTIDDLPLPAAEPASIHTSRTPKATWLLALCILLAAMAVRIIPTAGFTEMGFDEALYREYIVKLDYAGLAGYPAMCQLYLEKQRQPKEMAKLPPTRFLYIYTSWLWKRVAFGDAPPLRIGAPGFFAKDPALVSLHRVACLFSILAVAAAGCCAYRMLGPGAMLGVLALFGFSPTQMHMAQHALIDGFFAFWALLCLWMLWENLRQPNSWRWLAALGAALALLVMTKENSFFVCLALAGLVVVNRWAKFGKVTPSLIAVGIAGPLAGTLVLVTLAGGHEIFIAIYHSLVTKAQTLRYAILTGDGPWHRYLIDMLIVSPIVLLLAVGGVFTQLRKDRAYLYLALFVAFTYAAMCNVRYAMNLRYATIWDLPICALALGQLDDVTRFFRSHQKVVLLLIITALACYGVRQYAIFFSDFGLYELITSGLLHAVKILK